MVFRRFLVYLELVVFSILPLFSRNTLILFFKGNHPTWRIGPDMSCPKCWLCSDYEGDINGFDAGQEACKSGMNWYEYRKGKWQPIWLFRMYDSGKVPDTEGTYQ